MALGKCQKPTIDAVAYFDLSWINSKKDLPQRHRADVDAQEKMKPEHCCC